MKCCLQEFSGIRTDRYAIAAHSDTLDCMNDLNYLHNLFRWQTTLVSIVEYDNSLLI